MKEEIAMNEWKYFFGVDIYTKVYLYTFRSLDLYYRYLDSLQLTLHCNI